MGQTPIPVETGEFRLAMQGKMSFDLPEHTLDLAEQPVGLPVIAAAECDAG